MTLIYPDSWKMLKHPSKRVELIEYLSELAKAAPGSSPSYSEFDIDECVHFFFDDTDLGESGSNEVGLSLLDLTESAAIDRLLGILDSLIDDLGDGKTASFLAHPKWSQVQSGAKEALDLILKRGRPEEAAAN